LDFTENDGRRPAVAVDDLVQCADETIDENLTAWEPEEIDENEM
jgi:hypothetical protein